MGAFYEDPTKPVKTNIENQLKKPTEVTTTLAGSKGDIPVTKYGNSALANPVSNKLAASVPVGLENALPPLTEESGVGAKLGTAGLSALAEAPKVISMMQTDPTSKEEATGKVLSMASSGAKIGSAFGPWGTAIGAAVGTGAGLIDNAGWKGRLNDKNDAITEAEAEAMIAERKQNYYDNNTSKQMEANRNIYLKAQGYTT